MLIQQLTHPAWNFCHLQKRQHHNQLCCKWIELPQPKLWILLQNWSITQRKFQIFLIYVQLCLCSQISILCLYMSVLWNSNGKICWINSVRICPISRPSTSIWALRKHSSRIHILPPWNHQVNILGEDLRKTIFFCRQATIGPTAVNSIMSFNYAGGTPYKVDQ